jgi:hypothetical protein
MSRNDFTCSCLLLLPPCLWQALLFNFLAWFSFAFFYTLAKRFLALAESFGKLRQPGGAEKQKDNEHDNYKLRGSEPRDREYCLTHNFLLS